MDFSVQTSAAREARGRGANDAIHGQFLMLAAQRAQGASSPNQRAPKSRAGHLAEVWRRNPHGLTWIRNSVPARLLTYAHGEGMMSRESTDQDGSS